MFVDSYFQLMDRHLVAQLKMRKFKEQGDEGAVKVALEESNLLQHAMWAMDYEVQQGMRKPLVKVNNRFHDHAKVEGKEFVCPESIDAIRSRLYDVHCEYWDLQTRINELKQIIARPYERPQTHFAPLEQSTAIQTFVEIQREIDLRNQERNLLIELGDHLYAKGCNGLQ